MPTRKVRFFELRGDEVFPDSAHIPTLTYNLFTSLLTH